MKKNEKELILSTLTLFIFCLIFIFIFIYAFLSLTEFSPKYLLYAMELSLFLALGLGYLVAKHALAFSFSTHAVLRTITKNILHELNIPIATIKGNIFLIQKDTTNPKILERLQRIQKASDAFLDSYKELDYVIKKEIKDVNKIDIELKNFVEKRIDLFLPHKINLDLENCNVFVQEIGLKRCIDNLLSNAIKYGQNKPVDISLKLGVLKIKDRGMGIESEQIAKIFTRYYKIDKNTQGKGIGLSLVKEFCDNNSVIISIDSKPKIGTIFSLDFSKAKKQIKE